MSRHLATAVLTIGNGLTKSSSIQDYWGGNPGKVGMDAAVSITIKAPAALTAVVTVQIAQTNPALDADFVNYQEVPGTDLVIAAGKAITIRALAAKDLRLISAGAEGAARDFYVSLQEDIG